MIIDNKKGFMKKTSAVICSALFGLLATACGEGGDYRTREQSTIKVTSVAHTPVKRQSINNCWLYAKASWLESKLKFTTGMNYDVSESYWTYWDLYHKLLGSNESLEELQIGGNWTLSANIIRQYGWVEERDFIAGEEATTLSRAQKCAVDYLEKALLEGGSLFNPANRNPAFLRAELDKAFSCNGEFTFDMNRTYANRKPANTTYLIDAKTRQVKSLAQWLSEWTQVRNQAHTSWSYYEGKKLPSSSAFNYYRQIEQRIKRALNDHQPVVLTFHVSFNAPDDNGLFNLNSLASRGNMGTTGGHMVVLHDYTVTDVPGVGRLGEGEMIDELKTLALQGKLDYLVAKNSWGANRIDRPWLKNGYSRLSWDYLTQSYYDEESEMFLPFMKSVIFPPGY